MINQFINLFYHISKLMIGIDRLFLYIYNYTIKQTPSV